jgi:acetyl esterase
MPLEPVIRVLTFLANRAPDPDPDIPFADRRLAGARSESRLKALVMRPGTKGVTISHQMIPVEGGSIPVRLYRPHDGPLPLHVFFHGGGWVQGTLDARDGRCADIAAGANCVVASVDYRLAPENQYPTPPEDCYAALCWLMDNAARLDLHPTVVSVGGESAGGNLAAVVALMARDRNGPRLALQMLDIPVTDLTLSQPSMAAFATGYLLTRANMEEFVQAYVADPSRITEPYASPLHAEDLAGVAPAWIMTAEFDPLRDDGAAHAERLRAAGVPVDYQEMKGNVHASFILTRLLASARAYNVASIAALRKAYAAALAE